MSARFLAYFGRRVHRLPVLLVGSMRPEDLLDAPILSQALAELRAQGRLDEIPLRALAKDETRLLARSLHAGARRGRVGNRMVDDVWMVSEGNPFVVVESMQAIREEARDSGRFGSPLARSVRDFVAGVWIGSGKGYAICATAAVIEGLLVAPGSWWPGLNVRPPRRWRSQSGVGFRHMATGRSFRTTDRRVADDRPLPATRPTPTPPSSLRQNPPRTAGRRCDRSATTTHGRATSARRHLIRFAELAAQRYALEEAPGRSHSLQRSTSYRCLSTTARAIEQRFMSASEGYVRA
jgi:hypothetical protein